MKEFITIGIDVLIQTLFYVCDYNIVGFQKFTADLKLNEMQYMKNNFY